jgi:hypothetical protein
MARTSPMENGLDTSHHAASGGSGDGGDGVPYWAAGLRGDVRTLSRDIKDLGRDFRADVKDLGKEFRGGIRGQTYALVGIAFFAMILNSALIIGSIYFRAGSDGITVQTQNSAAPAPSTP